MAVRQCTSSSKLYSSTYLPQIIVKEGWTKHQTLNELRAKAGASGIASDSTAQVVRYQAVLGRASYSDYGEATAGGLVDYQKGE